MMRDRLLAVHGDTFDVLAVRGEIERIALAFGDYLSQTGSGGGSKHKALGPVGKALQHARAVRGEALLGYARRVHEQVTGTSYPAGVVEKLDEGLRLLDALLGRDDVPARAHSEILSRIDYATYYDVRRRGMEFLSGWQRFAREHAPQGEGTGASDLPKFSRARRGELGETWKKIAEEYRRETHVEDAALGVDEDEGD